MSKLSQAIDANRRKRAVENEKRGSTAQSTAQASPASPASPARQSKLKQAIDSARRGEPVQIISARRGEPVQITGARRGEPVQITGARRGEPVQITGARAALNAGRSAAQSTAQSTARNTAFTRGGKGRDAYDSSVRRNYAERGILGEYAGLAHNPDFAEKSQYVSTATGGEARLNPLSGWYTDSGFGDITYDLVNKNETARRRQAASDAASGAWEKGLDSEFLQQLTDEETAIFNYLYARDDAAADAGHASAYAYLGRLKRALNERQRGTEQKQWAAYAAEHPVEASALSVLASPAKGLSYLGQAADYLSDGEMDQNAGYNRYSYLNSAIRNEVNSIVEDKWGGVGSFAYQTGMSMGDFLLGTAITGGNQALSLAIMGTGAAADTVIATKDAGLSDDRAFVLGTIAGAAEIITEKVSLEALLDKTALTKSAMGYFLKNTLAEGSEEVGSDIINLVADVLISKDKSEWQTSIDAYEAEGMTEKEAFWRAVRDQAENMGLDFLGGAVSGGVMSGAGIAINAGLNEYGARRTGAEFQAMGDDVVQATIQEGLASDPSTQSYKLAVQLQQKLDKGETITNAELGRLYQANVQAIDAEDASGDILLRAADEVTRKGRVTNSTATDILDNPSAMNTLAQEAGLSVTEDMSKAQQRKAVKTAVEGLARARETARGETASTETTENGTAFEAAQARPAAQQVHDIKQMRQASSALGENGAKALNAVYDGSAASDTFYAGFSAYYEAGVSGTDMSKVRSEYSGYLNQAQKFAAYAAGQNDAAVSLAKERRAAQFAKVAGTDSGLVFDDYVASSMDTATADQVNSVAKALGVRVRFVDSVRGGTANAQVSGSDILVEKNNPNPVMFLLGHEWTHRMQELAPDQYRAFRDAVAEEAQGEARVLLDQYRRAGEDISYEAALDEAAANYAGRMIEDGKVLDDFIEKHREDRTLLEKVRDAIRSIIAKLTGAERRQAKTAEGKLTAALEASAKQASALQNGGSVVGTEGGYAKVKGKFSLKGVVEDNGELLALHNKDENSILAALKLGGLPMPSIAIVKARDGHTKYGPISLVFSKDTIDPQADSRNKVYGGDAWTPTAPRVDYKVNSKRAGEIERELHRLASDTSVAGGIFGSSSLLRAMGIDESSTRNTAELAKELAQTDTVRAAYLADQGKSLESVKMDSEIDRLATSDALHSAVDGKAVEKWIAGKLDGLLGEAGIYNGKTPYTPSGKQRSFSQLHHAYTLENIVKAMKEGQEERGGNTWGASAKTLQSVATPEYRSIQEIKADSGRLGMDEGAEYEAKLQAIDDQIGSIITKIKQGNKAHSDNSFVESDIIGSILVETAKGKKTVDAIMRAFSKEGYKISSQTAQDIQTAYKAAAEMPTGYFEAKPQRAVGFDEVLAAVIPDDSSKKLRDGLEQAGVRMLEYKTGDDADRLAKINSVDNARFSLKTVPPVKPTSDDWKPGATFDEVKAAHPTLFALDADEADTRNPTQITGTVKSYRKIYDALQTENFDGTILDASSGLGYGTRAGREEYGFDVDDIEPFPDEKYKPMFTDYSALDKTYDVIINNAVLNVMPQDLRDALVVKMGEMLKPGGRAFINVRGTDVKNASSKVAINDDLMEYFISNTGSYQKGFTQRELVAYLKDALGDGFSVEPTKKFGGVSAIVTRDLASYSLKGSETARETAKLREENDLLRERVEYWKGQTRRTQRVTTDKKAVAAAAKQLIQNYGADIAVKDIQGDLQSLYGYIASGYDGPDELSYTEARRRAEAIARKLVESAVTVDDDMYDAYSDLRDYLRTTKIIYGKEYHGDIADYGDFRKRQFGRLNLGSEGHTNIDQVYQELSSRWPEFFSEQEQTHPTDQFLHIVEVLDGISEINEYNPFSRYMDQAVTGAANEIMETFFDLPQTRKTFADRQALKLENAKAKGREQVQKVREQYTTRLAELREQNRQRVQDAISKERDRRDKQIEKLKTHYREKDAAGRERRNARELRAKIVRHANALSQKLLRPSDKQHIPESLRGPVAAMLESINQESAYSVDPETGKRRKGDDGLPTKRTEAFRALKEQYAKIIAEGGDMVIDPSLLGSDAEGIRGSFDAVIAMKDTRLADMTTAQLETVWQVVKAVEHSVSTAGKVLSQAKYARTADWAQALSIGTGSRRAKTSLTRNHALIDLETPYTFFSHYGEAGHAVYRTLRNAQDQQQLMVERVAEEVGKIVDPKTVKSLEGATHTFTTERGETLTLSTAQVMELYELMKRKQAEDHLLKGGIVQPEIKSAKIRRGTDAILLTAGDLAAITGTLTDKQVQIADGLQGLTTGLLADYGNHASMTAYGYKKFTGTDYWPIKSAKEGIHSTVERGGNNTRSIQNIGLAKTTMPHASNPLDLAGIFSTFSAHAADMTDYAAWLCTMEDLNRLYNFKFRDGEGNLTGKTIKGLLDRVGGTGAQKYWNNLMEDIQNGINAPSDSPSWDIIGRGIGSFKGAAVGANLRVVIQQPTAFFRAGAVLSPADLSRGLARGVTRGNGWSKALQYSPIAKRKDMGGFDISSPRQMSEILFDSRTRVRKLNDALSAPAGMADAITWGRLWNACEWATAREHKSLQRGSEAFYQKVNELFTEVIDQTQVVDGVLQRSNIMRSSNAVVKQATSFMGEPIMSLNLLMRTYDQVRYEQDSKKRGRAIKTMGRAATALVVTNIVNALAQSLIDAMRDDDEDKKYWERFRAAFTGITGEEESVWDKAVAAVFNGNVGSNMNLLGQIPFVKDALSMLQGYDVSRTEMEIIADLIEAGQTAAQSAGGAGKKTRAYAAKELLAAGAKVFGIPVGNLARDMWGLARSITVETDNIPLQYEMEKAIYNISNSGNEGRYYDILFRALAQGDMDSYQHIRSELMEEMGVDGASIDSAMRSRYNKALEADPGFTLSQQARDLIGSREQYAADEEPEASFGAGDLGTQAYQAYADQRAGDYREMADNLKRDPIFQGMSDEDKDKVLAAAYNLADKTALEDHSDGQYAISTKWMSLADDAEAVGIEPWEYVLFHMAYNMAESTKDADGKTVKGEAKSDHVREWLEEYPGITEEQRAFLWWTVYTGEW